MTRNTHTQIAIIGGGLVGSAMALTLAQAGIPVTLVEARTRRDQLQPSFDGRTSAIAYGSVKILESIGIWQTLDDTCPITDIRVCDEGGRFYVHYDYREAGEEPFGHIVENRLLRKALFDAVDQHADITVYEPCTLASYQADSSGISLQLSDGTELRAALMLVADGKFSQTRAMAGIEPELFEYGQTAIVATIAHSEPHHGLAVEAFYPAGPFAILPMTQQRSNIVWTERDAMAVHLLTLPEEIFLDELRTRVGTHLGEISLVGTRHSYPLMLIKAEKLVDGRIALIGDAGHGIHPIAGQGVNLGYRDVAVLAEMLVDQARLGLDLGDAALLARYASTRKHDIGSMSLATDLLNRLFSNRLPGMRPLRDIGLGLVERTPALKQFFMRQAMGMGGSVPKMMRGESLNA